MDSKKIYEKIKDIELEYVSLKKELEQQKIFGSKLWSYLKEDKEEFRLFWFKYIEFFEKLKKILNSTRYRKMFFKIDYNKLVLRKYLIHFYYSVISDLLGVFWAHNEYIRVFLDENFKKDYGVYAKYIYKPRFIYIYNIPILFIEPFKSYIDKDIFDLIYKIKTVASIKRIWSDYDNLFFWIKYRVNKFLFIVFRFVWNMIAHTRFSTRNYWLITYENCLKYIEIAKPWDILLTRWNWNASNISIPWFWKHMAMYIWSWEYLKSNFTWSNIDNLDLNKHYIIEATSKWIYIEEFDYFVSKIDYLGVARTSFGDDKIKRVIGNSFVNLWKEYDFIFNYYSDKRLVCTALVLKSYSKEFSSDDWIEIELEKISVWLAYLPNNFIKKINEEAKKENPSIFGVFFIDSIEKTWENFINSVDELLKSWKRPKLSMFLK